MKTNDPSPQNKLVVLLLAFIVIGISVAWNMPTKEALKSRVLRHVKITETKSNGITSVINAEKMEVQKSFKQNQFKLYTNKINFQPNNKFKTNFTFSGNKIAFVPEADTIIQSKNKFKIVLEDSVGNKKEYNSIEELPAEARKEFLKENLKLNEFQKLDFDFKFLDSNKLVFNNKFYSSPEWKKQAEEMRKQAEDMRKQFNSPEFKLKMEKLRKESRAIGEQTRKQFDNPEFKLKMKSLQDESRAIGEQAKKQFDSPEFKLLMEKLQEESKAIGEQAQKQFNSPEWKKQMKTLRLQSAQMSKQGEAMRKYYQSPEWKKQQKKMQNEIEKSQKEWKKSYDVQPKPAMPEKSIAPQKQ